MTNPETKSDALRQLGAAIAARRQRGREEAAEKALRKTTADGRLPGQVGFLFPIRKADRLEDGSLVVEGDATTETPDKQNDVMDFAGSVAAFGRWRGNVREQHDPTKAVGKALEWWPDAARRAIRLRARISAGAPDTIRKIADGVLTSFSIGGAVRRFTYEEQGGRRLRRVLEWDLSEVSLVDAGANPDAGFQLVKAGQLITAEPEPAFARDVAQEVVRLLEGRPDLRAVEAAELAKVERAARVRTLDAEIVRRERAVNAMSPQEARRHGEELGRLADLHATRAAMAGGLR